MWIHELKKPVDSKKHRNSFDKDELLSGFRKYVWRNDPEKAQKIAINLWEHHYDEFAKCLVFTSLTQVGWTVAHELVCNLRKFHDLVKRDEDYLALQVLTQMTDMLCDAPKQAGLQWLVDVAHAEFSGFDHDWQRKLKESIKQNDAIVASALVCQGLMQSKDDKTVFDLLELASIFHGPFAIQTFDSLRWCLSLDLSLYEVNLIGTTMTLMLCDLDTEIKQAPTGPLKLDWFVFDKHTRFGRLIIKTCAKKFAEAIENESAEIDFETSEDQIHRLMGYFESMASLDAIDQNSKISEKIIGFLQNQWLGMGPDEASRLWSLIAPKVKRASEYILQKNNRPVDIKENHETSNKDSPS